MATPRTGRKAFLLVRGADARDIVRWGSLAPKYDRNWHLNRRHGSLQAKRSRVSHVTQVVANPVRAHLQTRFDVIGLLLLIFTKKQKGGGGTAKMSDMEDEMYVEDDEDYDLVGDFCHFIEGGLQDRPRSRYSNIARKTIPSQTRLSIWKTSTTIPRR